MTLLGLPAAQLAPALALGSGVLVALYLLKQQRRRVPVPFARLWQRVLRESESSALQRRLKRLLSLLLQLVMLALLVLALGDPRLSQSRAGRTLVLLVDTSASMQARTLAKERPTETRLDVARQKAGKAAAQMVMKSAIVLTRNFPAGLFCQPLWRIASLAVRAA